MLTLSQYGHKQIRGFAGAVDGPIDHEFTKTRTNKISAQAGTLTVGGSAADGIYSVTIVDPSEPDKPIAEVEFDRADSEDNNAISAALNVLLIKALLLKASVGVASAVNTINFKNPGITYQVTTSAPAGASLTWAQTVAAGGTELPFGRFVRGGGDGWSCRPLVTGSVIADVIGVVIRELTVQHPAEGVQPGDEASILGVGPILVMTEQDVTPADTVYIRKETGSGGTEIGVVRKDSDSSTAISAATVARFEESASAGSLVRVFVNIPLMAA